MNLDLVHLVFFILDIISEKYALLCVHIFSTVSYLSLITIL